MDDAPNTEALAARAQRFSAFRDVPHEKLAILPKGASPEAQLTVLQRLGAPNNASGYDFTKTGVPQEMHGWAAETALKAGLLPHQAQHIAEKFAGSFAPSAEAEAERAKANADAEMGALQKEWGGAYLQNMEIGRRAMRHAERQGHDAAGVLSYLESAIGPAAAIKVASFLGRSLIEGDFIDGATDTPASGSVLDRMYKDV